MRRPLHSLQNILSSHLKGVLFALLTLVFILSIASQAYAVLIPCGGALSKDGSKIYVPDQSAGYIRVYNASTGAKLKDVNVFGYPESMVISPDGNYLYVSVAGTTPSLQVYNIGGADPCVYLSGRSLGTSCSPKGIAISPDGTRLYIADSSNASTKKVHVVNVSNPASPVELAAITGLPQDLYGVAVKPDGSRLYVSQRVTAGQIFVYDLTGASPTYIKAVSGFYMPTYLVASNDGTKLLVRIAERSGAYNDVSILNTQNDSLSLIANVSAISAGDEDPNNSYAAESLSMSPNGQFFYVSHFRTYINSVADFTVHTYGFATDNVANRWQVASGDTSKDFSILSPNALTIYLSYSANGTFVKHNNTGYTNGIPTAPTITYPLKGAVNVSGSVLWIAAQDDGGAANLVYNVDVILGSQLSTNNWTRMANTSAGATSAAFAGLVGGQIYYVRVRAYDGTNCGPWAYSGPFTMGVGPTPTIGHFEEPTSHMLTTEAFVYDSVDIIGTNFGPDPGAANRSSTTNHVTIAGLRIAISEIYYWSDTKITFGVPLSIETTNIVGGPNSVEVTAGGQRSNALNLIVRPRIWSLSPNSGPVNVLVTLNGNAYGNSQGSSTVTFNGLSAGTAVSWSNQQIQVNVPTGLAAGPATVLVTVGGAQSNPQIFTVTDAPAVLYLSPASGNQGETLNVQIIGSNTHFVNGATTVNFGSGILINYVIVTDPLNAIANISIDPAAVLGSRSVTVSTGAEILSATFTVTALGTPMLLYAIPDNGNRGQSLAVRIIGSNTNFTVSSAVAFSNPGITVNGVSRISATELVADITISAGAALGACNITVTTGPQVLTLGNGFTVNDASAPMLLYASPDNADQGTTGLNVHIFGANTSFLSSGISAVSFSGTGVNVNSYNAVSETELVVNISIDPSATVGYRTIMVTTGGVTLSLVDGFRVNGTGTPVLLYAIPDNANQGDSLTVRIVGSNTGFNGTTTVAFNNPGITVNSANVIDATNVNASISISGSAALGPCDITVTTGGIPLTLINGFTVNASTSPEILSIIPSREYQGNTVTVTVTGRNTNFVNGTTSLAFSGTGITVNRVTVMSQTSFTAEVSINASAPIGLRDVIVTTAGEIASLANGFTVLGNVPTLLYLSPDNGDRGETINVKIAGVNTHFVGGSTTANFGAGITLNYLTVIDATNAIANITIDPAAALGARAVTVSTGAENISGTFTVNATGTAMLLYVAPDNGDRGQTLDLKVIGSNTSFTGNPTVSFSNPGITVNSSQALSATEVLLNVTISAGAALGPCNVMVGALTLANGFTVNPVGTMMLLYASPDNGNRGVNGLNVHIFGYATRFLTNGLSAVAFTGSGITINYYSAISETELVANINIDPSAALGYRTILVTSGGVNLSLMNGFRVNPSSTPMLLYAIPDNANQGDSLTVRLIGLNTNFNGTTAVAFNNPGITVNGVSVVDATNVNASISISGSAALGPCDITVTTSGVPLTLVNGFTVNLSTSAELLSIIPSSEYQGNTVTVTVEGRNTHFANGVSVLSFSNTGITVSSVNVISATRLTASLSVAADAPIGLRDVVVTTASELVSLANGFNVLGTSTAPAILHFEVPTTHAVTTEGFVYDAIDIIGTNFGADPGAMNRASVANHITIGGLTIATTEVYFWSDTKITIGIPLSIAGAPIIGGANAIQVTGSGILSNALNLTVRPRIYALIPSSGPIGRLVTIEGTAFGNIQDGSAITFNGVNAGSTVSWSDTTIEVNVPALATTGPVVATVNGAVSNNDLIFTITAGPAIDHFENPTTHVTTTDAYVYDSIDIIGTNFGADPGAMNRASGANHITIAGLTIATTEVYFWSDTKITIGIPLSIAGTPIVGGANAIRVTSGGIAGNNLNLTVHPRIYALIPNSGPIGQRVTIEGTAFGTIQGGSTITFNSVNAGTAISWSDTTLEVNVPAGTPAGPGPVIVTVNGALSNNDQIFTVNSGLTDPVWMDHYLVERQPDTTYSVFVNWGAIAGATSYDLMYRIAGTTTWTTLSAVSIIDNPFDPNPNHRLTGLTGLVTYEVSVRGNNVSGSSNWFSPAHLMYMLDMPWLAHYNVTQTGPTFKVTMIWKDVFGATSYVLQYWPDGGVTQEVYPVSPNTTTELTGLVPNLLYHARIKAVRAGGGESQWSNIDAWRTVVPPLWIDHYSVTSTQAHLIWEHPIAGALSYTISYGTDEAATNRGEISGLTDANATDYLLTGLAPNTWYYVKVKAVHAAGDSDWSGINTFYTLPAPQWMDHYNLTLTSVDLTWESVAQATSYTLIYSTSSSFTNPTTVEGLTSNFTHLSGLTPNTVYYAKVKAVNAGGWSDWGPYPNHTFTTGIAGILYLSPNNGNRAETLNIAIVGSATNFVDGSTAANFGAGITVNYLRVVDPTHAFANISIDPAASLGARTVNISTGLENLSATFTVNALGTPMLLSVIPNTGDRGETLPIRVIGSNTNFTSASTIIFGNPNIFVYNIVRISSTELSADIAMTPTAAIGPCDVTVTTGPQALTLVNGFTVNPQATPMLIYASPDNANQGTTNLNVHIYSMFTSFMVDGISQVVFTGSGINVNSFSAISATELIANITVAPTAALGYRSIMVTTGGTTLSLLNGFRVNSASTPTLLFVIPDNANQGDSLVVRVIGSNTNFDITSVLSFSNPGIAVGTINVIGATTLDANIVISGTASLGACDVTVTTGGIPLTLLNGFTVNAGTSPEILSVIPSREYQGNTVTVTIIGRNTNWVNGITAVNFSGTGITVNSVNVISPTALTANISIDAAAPTGFRDVVVSLGSEIASRSNGFEVLAAPASILYLVPSSGNQGLQNLNVRIFGNNTHFAQGVTTASFGAGITVNYTFVIDPTNAVANISIAGGAGVGARVVSVTTNTETVNGAFSVTPSTTPALLYVVPDSGYQGVTNLVLTVVGVNTSFVNGVTAITFSNPDIVVNATSVLDATHALVSITIPISATTGPCDVTATTGVQVVTLGNGFTVYSASQAMLIRVVPAYGYQGTNNLVLNIYGINTNFSQGLTTVAFTGTGITVNSVTVHNTGWLTTEVNIAPTATVGPRNVTVITDGERITQVNGFTVLPNNGLWMGIDPFEGTEGITHYVFGSGADATYETVNYHDGLQGYRALYSFNAGWGGGWGGALPGKLDISHMTCVTFWVRGDGSANRARFDITEADGDVWSSHDPAITGSGYPLTDTNWHQIILPFTSLIRNVSQSTGDGTFNGIITNYNFVYTTTNTSVANQYIDTIYAELRDLNPPSRIMDLRVTKVGANGRLDWSPATDDIGVLGYRVFHSSSANGPWTQLGPDLSAATLTYTHLGAVSDPSDHYYYVVAFDAASEAQRSNVASIIKRNLTYVVGGANNFWVSIPYINPYTNAASMLADLPLAVIQVSRLNPVTKAWETYTRASGGINFAIITGEGYEVKINASTTLVFAGAHDLSFVFNLTNLGENLISIPYNATYADARAIVNSINAGLVPGTCVLIKRLNPATQTFENLTWVPLPIGGGTWIGGFNFVPGEAYDIVINGSTNWQPSVY